LNLVILPAIDRLRKVKNCLLPVSQLAEWGGIQGRTGPKLANEPADNTGNEAITQASQNYLSLKFVSCEVCGEEI